jgi:hypothetical protein
MPTRANTFGIRWESAHLKDHCSDLATETAQPRLLSGLMGKVTRLLTEISDSKLGVRLHLSILSRVCAQGVCCGWARPFGRQGSFRHTLRYSPSLPTKTLPMVDRESLR